ncbi:MAG: thioesterase family protein, partial [Spirochaetes bacterium]|nr:thioesterase family protein [Spirochaetota bacterium]
QHGYSIADFKRLGFGPVVYEDTISYYQELFMYEEFSVNLMMKGMSQDGSRFYFVNDFRKLDGTAVASIHTKACWFDLEKRKIIPPPDLFQIMNNVNKAQDFEIISKKNVRKIKNQ